MLQIPIMSVMSSVLQMSGIGPAVPQILLQALPLNAVSWLPLAFAAVLIVFGVAGIVYMVGSMVNSPTAKSWSRMQIYEAVMSIVMIMIFITLSSLFMLNITNSYNAAKILPPACSSAGNVFSIASCDLANFNYDAGEYFLTLYDFSAVLGSADPRLSFDLTVPVLSGIHATSSTDILPRDFETLLGILFTGIITMLLLNQVQMILLSGSLLFLSFFLVLGLISRTLGFSRRFGGAMIAFGLGLGFVYPLITSLTYGFIDYSIGSLGAVSTIAALVGGSAEFIFDPTGGAGLVFTGGLGYIIAGLTFIPFLNFTILEAFITDFSAAIGERVSFMALLSTVV